MPDTPHVVIIGGGFGGLDAARALDDRPVRVTLIDRHNYHLFQPLLYQVATASLSPGDIASPIRWVLRRQRNVQVLLAEARAIDLSARRVAIDPGPARGPAEAGHHDGPPQGGHYVLREDAQRDYVQYDYLIVASGATHSYFGHPEWAARAPGLKTLDDALEMRKQVLLAFEAAEREADPAEQKRLLTFVIIGAGPTGVELAGALAEIARQSLREDFRRIHPESARIVLLEGSPHVLPAFPEPLRKAARRSLERLGVEVRTESVVTGIDAEGVSWRPASSSSRPGDSWRPADSWRPGDSWRPASAGPSVEAASSSPVADERIVAQTVLWAAGVAASPLAKSLGVPLDRVGRVLAEPTLAVPGHPEVFVVGDICSLQQDGTPLPGVAQVAKQGGAHAARNVLHAVRGEGLEPFRYRDYGTMATIGRGSAVAEFGPIKASGLLAWLIWLFIHIFWLIGFRNRMAVMGEWAWAYVTFQRRVRLITGEKLWPGS